MSYCDQVFRDNCREILDGGFSDQNLEVRPRWDDGSPAHTVKQFGLVNRYDLQKEFPIMTLRKINFRAAIDELLWIWQKKSNRVCDLNSGIWNQWCLPDGTIGKAYGYQLGIKHSYPEGDFDQVDRVLYELRNNPGSRRMMTNLYNFSDLNNMALYPCAYSMTFNVTGDRLNGILNQRSNDMLVANNWNVMQYAILLVMMAQASGFLPGQLLHVIADAHIYDRHIPIVEELILRPDFPAPTLRVDPDVTDFYDFTVDSFELDNYQHGPLVRKIPVAT